MGSVVTTGTSETSILKDILRTVGKRDDVRIWRQNTGAGRTAAGAFVRFGIPGQADITGFLVGSGRRVELEVKTKTGRLSKKQKLFGEACKRGGVLYAVVRSVDEAMAVVDGAVR